MERVPTPPRLELEDSTVLPVRRHARYAEVEWGGHLPLRTQARLVDLSLEGVGIETREPMPLRRTCWVSLRGRDTLALRGEPVWQQVSQIARTTAGSDPLYRGGVRLEVSAPQRAALERFLTAHEAQQHTRREPPRYRLRVAPELDLAIEHRFQIETMSRSGMLIELDSRPLHASTVDVVVDAPDGPLGLRARVVDVFRAGQAPDPRMRLALAFDDVTPETLARLDRFLP